MLRRTTPRRGFSLTEVLVALFVMAVGIISLLTLFPVGAVQMGHALRDDRAQTTALQADAYIRLRWQQFVLEGGGDWYSQALSNPGVLQPADGYTALAALPYPSYPVLFDPIGHQARGGDPASVYPTPPAAPTRNANVLAAAYRPTLGFPRRTAAALNQNYIATFRSNSLLDDIEFGRDPNAGGVVGAPANGTETGSGRDVTRYGQYNWAAVIQRPNNTEPRVADLKILVFHRRPPGIAPQQSEVCYPNPANPTPVPFQIGSTQLIIPDTLDNLKIRVGAWVMDGTIDPAAGIRNANFYRIQSISENTPAAGQTTIELQTPIKVPTGTSNLTTGGSYNGQLYILDSLVEVFDRPQLAPGTYLPQVP